MILSGEQIADELGGNISIQPYRTKQLNPNSYNLRLHNELVVYTDPILDMKKLPKVETIEIPTYGYVLVPGVL